MFQVLCYFLPSPSQELLFSGDSNSDIICTLTLTNISKNTVAYKVRCVGGGRRGKGGMDICHSTNMGGVGGRGQGTGGGYLLHYSCDYKVRSMGKGVGG